MPKTVSVSTWPELATVIVDHELNVGDIVQFESENQMGEKTYRVVASPSGRKGLTLIWSAENGDLVNQPIHFLSDTHSDDEKAMEEEHKESYGGRSRSRKSRKGGKKSRKSRKSRKGGKKSRKSRKSRKGGKKSRKSRKRGKGGKKSHKRSKKSRRN